jgi:Amt family ammonium transporter
MARMRGKSFALTGSLAASFAFAGQAFAQTAGGAAPTAPYLVDASQISTGDTAWMLTSTALVLLMTLPGLALFYGGMVRKKNLLSPAWSPCCGW